METIDIKEALKQNIGVVEGLMHPLSVKGYAPTIDLNQVGIYTVSSDTQGDWPENKKSGTLIVLSAGEFRGMHFFIPDNTQLLYTRNFISTTFKEWRKL